MNTKFNTCLAAILIVCFCAFPMVGMSNVRAEGIPPGTSTVPTPLAPLYAIHVTPTFIWTKISGATQYRFAVYGGTTLTTLMYYKTVTSSTCGSTTCSNKPTNVLSTGMYTWKVRAYVGGAWKAYSPTLIFSIMGFVSEFTSDAAGWTRLKGWWSVGSGYYQTDGVPNYWASSAHDNSYSVFTYEVKLNRTAGCACSEGVFFNGVPSPLGTTGLDLGLWYTAYYFGFGVSNNSGYFAIKQVYHGTTTVLQTWTYSSYITSNWNTLKVTYNKSTHFAQFYINGHRVAYGPFTTISSGQVGVTFYRTKTDTTSHLNVDYAKLSLSAPTASASSESEGIAIDDSMATSALAGSDVMIAP